VEAAYQALTAAERARLVPELAAAETEVVGLDAQKVHFQAFVRFMHPEIPRRLSWLEGEMGSLGGKLDDTRMDLEEAMGADWAPDDPSWAPSAASSVSRSLVEPLDPGRARRTGRRPVPTSSSATWVLIMGWGCSGFPTSGGPRHRPERRTSKRRY
jgi:hypothetical protein